MVNGSCSLPNAAPACAACVLCPRVNISWLMLLAAAQLLCWGPAVWRLPLCILCISGGSAPHLARPAGSPAPDRLQYAYRLRIQARARLALRPALCRAAFTMGTCMFWAQEGSQVRGRLQHALIMHQQPRARTAGRCRGVFQSF